MRGREAGDSRPHLRGALQDRSACSPCPTQQSLGDRSSSLPLNAPLPGDAITGKGQLNFLEAVDWEDLVGYHIHFYGAGASELPEYVALLRKVASARRINATFHTLVDQAALLKHYCESVGQIHYPRGDANPRAPYEGIYAGNPLFVSEESHLNPAVYEQPFVVTVKSMCQEGFSGAFKEFMKLVRDQHKTVKMAQEFARKELKPYNTYRNICNMIGVCSP